MGAPEFCHLQRSFRKGMQAVVRDILLGPTREDRMGFMDKAKKLAEQAQEKLDEAQKNFNKGEGGSGTQPPAQGGVQYDEHGRPIQQETPAAATPPPAASPAPPAPEPSTPVADPTTPVADPTKPVEGEAQEPAEAPSRPAEAPPADPPSGGANSSPDPFKPLQQRPSEASSPRWSPPSTRTEES